MSARNDVFISSVDAQALDRLLSDPVHRDHPDESVLQLSTKLFDAQVVAPRALPHGTVRLNSTVTYEELRAGTQRSVTLVNPREADAGTGRISIFSPIGRALLGHAVGQVIDVTLPTGQDLSVRIVEVAFAPLDRLDEPALA